MAFLLPDMNPIGHAWDALGRAINERDNIPLNLQELAKAPTDERDALPIEGINKYVMASECADPCQERPHPILVTD